MADASRRERDAYAAMDEEVLLGPFTLRILQLFRAHGIVMQPQHGGTLNGESCQRFLQHHRDITSAIRPRQLRCGHDKPPVILGDEHAADAVDAICRPLARITRLGLRVTPLCEHERETFQSDVEHLHRAWEEQFPRAKEKEKQEAAKRQRNEQKTAKNMREEQKRRRAEEVAKEKEAKAAAKAKKEADKRRQLEAIASLAGKGKAEKKLARRIAAEEKEEGAAERERLKEEARKAKEQQADAVRKRKQERDDEKVESEQSSKKLKPECMKPTPKLHWLGHMPSFLNQHLSVRAAALPLTRSGGMYFSNSGWKVGLGCSWVCSRNKRSSANMPR